MSKERYDFIKESNKIENIHRDPTLAEIEEFDRFMALDFISIEDLERFVAIYQPRARLRDKLNDNVRVGTYLPPLGGPDIRIDLQKLLAQQKDIDSYHFHILYESLHPFTDGNGRSGRALWAWKVRDLSLGFLHKWYYQTLQFSRKD